MAKKELSIEKQIDRAIKQIVKDAESIIPYVVDNVAQKAQEDMIEQAVKVTDMYYDSYKPTSYKRTESLYEMIMPYNKHVTGKGKRRYSTQVGVI